MLEKLREYADSEIHPILSPDNWNIYSELRDLIDEAEKDALALLKVQEPIEARLHLCESCAKEYPECDATVYGIGFGCGVGNDNIIGCTAYVNRWKAQEPRVMTLEELDDLRGRGRAVYYEDRDAVAKCQDMFYLAAIGEYVYLKGETYVLPKRVDQYGKTWRCLTSRPTDEQRGGVEWE